MRAHVRIPYGAATTIVRNLRHGEAIIVRPCYVISFRKAARENGVYVVSNTIRKNSRLLWRLMRVAEGHPSGHFTQRMPERETVTGRFLHDERRAA